MAVTSEALPSRLSPTFLTTFLGCYVSAAWTLEQRRGVRPPPDVADDPHAALIVRKGHEHEARCLAALRKSHGDPVIIRRVGSPEERMAATVSAMDRGAPFICQAALADQRWIGYADFLVRVNDACPRWSWSYEPWDAKLARQARPEHVIQIAIYGDLLKRIQGRAATSGALMLGTDKPEIPYAVETFRLDDVRHYVRRAARRFEAFAGDPPAGLSPEPCGYCGKCDWMTSCEARWEETDHLCRVADVSRKQMLHLCVAGVSSATLLSQLGDQQIPGIGSHTLERLIQQARLQKQTAEMGVGVCEILPFRPGLGFDRLPSPDPGDLFFDFEGDPMHPGGLEYLCGILWRARTDDEEGDVVPGHPELRFLAFWAHDRQQEKRAFQELMDFLVHRLAEAPGAHLYHYAPYEKTALRRLASMHAVSEGAVDNLLRSNRMVDLYRVVREGIRVGEASYSIKSLERFYMEKRATEVVSGGASLVIYDRYRMTGDDSALHALRDYNRDDCLSTLLLRDWLIERADEAGLRIGRIAPAIEPEAETDEDRTRRENREARERDQAALETLLIADPTAPDIASRQLMADLVGFHRREEKPAYWAYFDRRERTSEELQDDSDCLGGCVADGEDWIGTEKRSLTYRFRYPEQEAKLRVGDDVYLALNGERAGEILALDDAQRLVTLKRGATAGPLPEKVCLIPGGPLDSRVLRDAVWTAAADIASGGMDFPHIAALLRRDPPRLKGWKFGDPIIPNDDRDDPGRLLAASIKAISALDRSWLVIQGPPGAGKTYTISHLIASLVQSGKTVGIASNSHKAIDNVLRAVETRFAETHTPVSRLGQKRDGSGDACFTGLGYIESVSGSKKVDPTVSILGGTAWLFARPELRLSRDVLFVDEAGQVSLGNLIAMAQSARAIVLVGDQMQLSQPIQGAHPRDSGCSALDHLLEGQTVVSDQRGIFLSKTWRMHPDLCRFVSQAVYDGKLESEPGCANQRLSLNVSAHSALKPAGLSFHPVDHSGCRQRSEEEAEATNEILASLLLQRVVDREGNERNMTLDDVLIVTPYNMQVNLLRARLPKGARVGTVDKFQGQEAEVVLVSMATSGAENMPRDAAFLLSRNRFNVAISRARCLAILIASPGLLDLVANSVEEMRLANLFCWAEAYAAETVANRN